MTCSDEGAVSFDYARYLAAKTTVDDRALNRHVLAELRRLMPAGAPRILEVGAGLGTMAARLMDWGVVGAGEYILLDADRQLLEHSRRWLCDWAAARGLRGDPLPDGLQVGELRVRLVHAELGSYLAAAHGAPADVLIANAVLDLVDVPAILPRLLRLLVPAGVYWFTINYDGETIFEPGHPLDGQVMGAYHRDMDERIRYGRPGKAERAAACFATCGTRRPPRWRRGPRTGSCTRPGTGTTRPMRLTFCTGFSIRSATRLVIALTGWNRRTWPTGWPCAAGSWPRATWSTSPTSSTSWAARLASPPPAHGDAMPGYQGGRGRGTSQVAEGRRYERDQVRIGGAAVQAVERPSQFHRAHREHAASAWRGCPDHVHAVGDAV